MKSNLFFARIALATLFGLMFGTFARDVARWSVCYTATRPPPCPHGSIVTAELIAVLLSTFLALYLAAIAVRDKPRSQKETAGVILGVLVGAFFVMLKVIEHPVLKYPDFTGRLAAPLVYLLIAVVVLPLALHRLSDPGLKDPLAPLRRLGMVFLTAFFLGAGPWLIAHTAWRPGIDDTSTTKFAVAPGVAVIAGAIFGVMMLHARVAARPGLAILFWAGVAIAFALAWYGFDYHPRQVMDQNSWSTVWLTKTPGSAQWMLDLPILLLLVSGVMMMAVILLGPGRLTLTPRSGAIALGFALVSGACGYWLGEARLDAGRATVAAPVVLALVHGVGPPLALASLLLGLHFSKTRGTQASNSTL